MAAAAKTKARAQICAVLGSDESEVKRAARDLAAQLAPADGGDFGTDIIDGTASGVDEAADRIHQTIAALLTFPFFGGEKLVWLKSANFLGDNPTGRSETVTDALEKLLETLKAGVPESTRFLLSATEIDKRRTFYKTLGKLAKVEVFEKLDTSRGGWEEQAALLVRESARERRLEFDEEGLELFVLFTGGERRVIDNELEKLALYLAGAPRAVSADDVRLLVPMARTGIIWELGNAIAERNLRRALDILEQLLFQGESEVGIMLVAIIPTVRNLLLVKDLMVRHRLTRPQQPFFFGKSLDRLSPDAVAHLPRKKDGTVNAYALGVAASHAHRYTAEELRRALDACLEANTHLVTSAFEPKTVLTQLIVKLTTKSEAAR